METRTYQRRKMLVVLLMMTFLLAVLLARMWYIMVNRSQHYKERADDLHERERVIKAERGIIYDSNGVALATNQSVCTISVIHNQITDPETVIKILSETLEMDSEKVRKRVEKVSSIERIQSNVPKETGDLIRSYKLDGVMVDEDYSRYYPYDELAAKIIGFTGGDNQGIIGLSRSMSPKGILHNLKAAKLAVSAVSKAKKLLKQAKNLTESFRRSRSVSRRSSGDFLLNFPWIVNLSRLRLIFQHMQGKSMLHQEENFSMVK